MNHEEPIIKNKEWIGRIPSDWDFVKIKEHFVERNTKVDDISFSPLSVSMGGVVDQMENVSKSDNSENRKLVKKNDFVINSRSDRKGSSGISPRDGSVSLINIVLKPKNINPKYSEYLFKSYYFKEEFFRNGKGIHFDLWSTRYELMKQIFIPYPKIEEQNNIVEYLDNKTHQIDKLTKKIEQKTKLLKEQRISIINEVVTKGLNPNVEMKDSGVYWVGEIPRNWKITKVKYISNLVIDGSHHTPTYTDSGIPFLRVTDLHNKRVDLDKVKFISEEEHQNLLKRTKPERGDVLLSKNGTIGLTKVIDWDWEFSIFVSLCLIKFKKTFLPELFSYFFQSSIVDRQIKESSKQSTVTNLHLDKIRELLLINPPITEQQEIIKYLDQKTKIVDETISKEERRIELLKEYKQSLISEVVTGKKRVV